MKAILVGQKIKIDNHHAGQAVKFNGLHIHKTVFGKNYNVEILVPFEANKSVQIRPKKMNSKNKNIEYNRIVKEINKVFDIDEKKRKQFTSDLIESIEKYSEKTSKIENLRSAAKTIAGHFQLEKNFQNEIMNSVEDRIKSLTTIHKEKNGLKLFYIHQSIGYVELGELIPNSTFYNLINRK